MHLILLTLISFDKNYNFSYFYIHTRLSKKLSYIQDKINVFRLLNPDAESQKMQPDSTTGIPMWTKELQFYNK